jgi:hypothetical protein
MTFISHGYEYRKDDFGIHQINPQPFTYDACYCSTYDTDSYKKGSDTLQALRLGFVVGSHGLVPKSIADIGYGNGAFLMRCKGFIPKLYGKDISGVTLHFVETVWHYPQCDVVTFHDVLEHIPDLDFLFDIPCETIIISCPFCHFLSVEWFDNYRHRKPNEHLHHWNLETLTNLMKKYGWKLVASSNHEDIVRIGDGELPNILSAAFKRK